VELAVRSIAKFHANWWEHRDLDRMEWLPSINDPVQQQAQPGYQQCWDPFSQMMGAALSPRMLSTGEALQHHIIGLQDLLNRAPRTISHGDFRADNMFFGGGGTSAFALADWQISTKGRGAFDLAYLFSGALDPSVRKAHEMRLLRLWHNLLVEAGVTGYSFDEALRDYRIGVLYSWMYVVIGVASLDPANERGMAFFNAWVLRRSRAVEELEAADLMPK
jgi:thiamine kinase-like enzyme